MSNIKIDVNVKNSMDQANKVFADMQKQNAFSGNKTAQTAESKALGHQKIINDLLKKTSWSDAQFKEFQTQFSSFMKIILTYSASLKGFSSEVQAASEKLQAAVDNLEGKRKERGNLQQERKKKIDALQKKLPTGQVFHKFNKDNQLSKQNLTFEKAAELIARGEKVGYIGSDNRNHTVSEKGSIATVAKEIVDVDKQINAVEADIVAKKKAVKEADAVLNKAIGDSPNGIILKDASQANIGVREGVSAMYKSKEQEETQDPVVDLNKQKTALGQAFKQFTIYAVAIRAAKSALHEAVSTIKELDKYLTEQAMVTGKTREETYALLGSYQDLAVQLGATTKEVAGVATEYMKQGKSTKDALILTEAAVSAAKVARVSVGDSVNYLTTALNGFRLEADQAMAVSDKFAAVAASSATDYDELAIALSKVASQANLAGMSIDYTTALLTKGLETTREAPETMGTALKTVIARMREMTDYGETLEGDTDINNVETQLAYVDIALKNTNGELRSTQDVLDELGHKWDTLNKNQQAAIAKALAGTRQQSRLIAMMDGYERVVELQEISERSGGATMAQMGTHLEGMEAAINRLKAAWESVVSALTNSDIIIWFIDKLGIVTDHLADFIGTTGGMITTLGIISVISLNILGTKIKEQLIAKKQYKMSLVQQRIDLERSKQEYIDSKNKDLAQRRELLNENKITKAQLEQKKIAGTITAEEQAQLIKLSTEIPLEEKKINSEEKQLLQSSLLGQNLLLQNSLLKEQESTVGRLFGGFTGIGFAIKSSIQGISQLAKNIAALHVLKKQGINLTKLATAEERKEALVSAAASVSKNAYWGWAVGLAILAAAGIGVAIAAATGKFDKDRKVNKTTEAINNLSNEIYKTNEKANALKEVESKFKHLDDKIIKTSKDIKEMNSLLESARDKLTEEEQKEVNWFGTPQQQMEAIKAIRRRNEDKSQELRDQQITDFNKLNKVQQKEILQGTDSDSVSVQNAFRGTAMFNLFNSLDNVEDLDKRNSTKGIISAIFGEMSPTEILEYAKNGNKVKDLVQEVSNIKDLDILQDESASIGTRIQAFNTIYKELDTNTRAFFADAFREWELLSHKNSKIIKFIDNTKMSMDQINNLYNANETLNKAGVDISKDEYRTRLDNALSDMSADFSNFNDVMRAHFGDLEVISDKEGSNWLKIIDAVGNHFNETLLNIGQDMTKFNNSINNLYEKATKWNTLSNKDKTEILSEFGEDSGELYDALESGDFDKIEKIIAGQDSQQKKRDEKLDQINRLINIETARNKAGAKNGSILEYYKDLKKQLESEDLYKPSLKLQIEQQNKQLDKYKEFLEDERKELEKSLEKRKEAYENYFERVNKASEDEDYFEKEKTLTSNISRLSSTDNASANKQRAELENELKQLHEERLKTLRERAQENMVKSIDNELKDIGEKFDKLLESNQALLKSMESSLTNPNEFIKNFLMGEIKDGTTALELQDSIGNLKEIFGPALGADFFDNISAKEDGNHLVLNIDNQEIILDRSDEETVATAIMQALRSIGKR